jgi:uncharacterized protein DUF4333
MKMTAAALAVLCAVLMVAVASTHSTTKTLVIKPPTTAKTLSLNTAKVETAIKTSIRLQRNMDAVVRCPSREPQEAGVTFTCTATTHRLAAPHAAVYTPFAATVQNARGYTTYVGR